MEKATKDYINKIKINTYIYTFTFIFLSGFYSMKHSVGPEPIMLLVAAFAFYTLGRQVRFLNELEEQQAVDTRPKAPHWVRGVTYITILILIFSVIFS